MNEFMQSLNNVKPRNAADRVYGELKKMLFNYQIVPGQKLQSEDFAAKFNVSRTPVNHALKMLEKEGYVELTPNKGYYVVEIGVKEVEELYDIRETLEILAVRRGIANQNLQSLKRLDQAMNMYAEDVKRPLTRKRLILDEEFHLAIAELSQNKTLVEILERVFNKIYLKHRIEGLSSKRGEIAKSEHQEIYQAILSKNVSLAVEKMRKHITGSRKNALISLQGGSDQH